MLNVNYVVEGQVDYESGFDGQSLDAGTSWLPFMVTPQIMDIHNQKYHFNIYCTWFWNTIYFNIRLFCKRGSGGTNNITIDEIHFHQM